MTRYFTSDPHIRHDLAIGYRGFRRDDGTVDHDSYELQLAENWDSRVKKDDHIYILGDLAMNPNKGAFGWLAERPGIIHFISGNHDSTHPLHSGSLSAQAAWMRTGLFASINSQGSVKIAGRQVLLSHFPYTGEGGRKLVDRYTQWRFRDEGMPLLHGHEHKSNVLEPDLPHQFHVGLDSWDLQLVHESSVEDWLDGVHDVTSF